MNHQDGDNPDFLDGLGDMLPADVLKKLNELLARLASHGVRHLGMGASSPKMRIKKRKSALASVSSCLGF